ncbi:MAG: hypothetical protein A2122_00635 [Candidatus Liptonbacteria bacterium GWB1_49_6]|uniref:DUF5666 domain-containing protein n=1 Tax=Candidatus Liptonbacteria bacterium GWB1_49_6 TaxID=1798644 RepID=A0A1G2C566_9BACT|nr:MAG: hypothetical protein A2122_00635 [Candidatus Liptonbacteria bacterium GWB1_49_6]
MKTIWKSALAMLVLIVASGCGPSEELVTVMSEKRAETGTVISREHRDKEYLNPLDNINPMSDIDPFFNMKKGRFVTMTPEKNLVEVQTSVGNVVWNDKILFGALDVGDKVNVEIVPRYKVTRDRKTGVVLSKVLMGHRISPALK